MADCTVFEELISAGLDGALTEEEQCALSAHLEECGDCRRYREALEGLTGLLAEEAGPPAALTGRIMDAVRAESARKRKKIRMLPLRCGALAAAVVLAVAVGARALPRAGKADASLTARAAGQAESCAAMAEDSPAEAAPEFPAPEAPAPEAEEGAMLFAAAENGALADCAEEAVASAALAEQVYRGSGAVTLTLYGDGRFSLTLDASPDCTDRGVWAEAAGRLTLTAEDGQNIYVFYREGEALAFDAEASSPLLRPGAIAPGELLR